MDNLRGMILMTASMAAFAVEDMFIKWLALAMPVGQILVLMGVGGAAAFAAMSLARGRVVWTRGMLDRPVVVRNLSETVGTLGFVSALALAPLSSVAAILQATPLAVTLGAALFLGESVGWRRWSAIVVGFLGVLMVVRPGMAGFQPASLLAVLGVAGLATRDLATRMVSRDVTSLQLSAFGFAFVVPAGLILLGLSGGPVPIGPLPALQIGLTVLFGVAGYYAIVEAMRTGEISAVTPFRYSRMIFALGIGIAVFGERPDGWTLAGTALIIGSGLYTIARERALFRRARGR